MEEREKHKRSFCERARAIVRSAVVMGGSP